MSQLLVTALAGACGGRLICMYRQLQSDPYQALTLVNAILDAGASHHVHVLVDGGISRFALFCFVNFNAPC
ncbi:hypothetical protein B0T17DRAFT_254453 [Bombardia bombarda]|uniref:Uncharacterized protein n=1 Tax=Bombardia bombarda TaxID=252184 RepID=A0AA39X054_9PEZI|nr:hypothetical protein B0T17DRAFT_254453 [Bombardia bombarda]